MKYDLIIFDLDGTLVDTFPWFLRNLNQVAAKFRFRGVQDHEVEALRHFSARQLIAHLKVPAWKLPFLAAHVRALAKAHRHETPIFEPAAAMLEALRARGIRIAVVSSNSEETVRALLGPLQDLVWRVEGSVSLFGKAPRFKKVMRLAGVTPARTLAVGDEIRDAEAAAKAGVPFGAVSWGMTAPAALQAREPALLFERMEDVAPAVLAAA
ncbi:MAG: HAD hydrolase-like protein [Caulobacteraceae bacterium]